MYPSKNSGMSPVRHVHKPQRDISPSNKARSGTKYYSTQQVSRMIKAYIQPKLNYLKNQLQQKQRIIAALNQKLDQNDEKINKLGNYIQHLARRQKQLFLSQNNKSSQQYQQSILLVNQLLNDKLKQYWQTLCTKLQNMRVKFFQQSQDKIQSLSSRIQKQIQEMKRQTNQCVQQSRIKNNNYWLKIKQALNRINSKISKVDQSILQTSTTMQSFRSESSKQFQYINQLQKSKQVIKKLIQLKKSVGNIYQNYENVLRLQNDFKQNIERVGMRKNKQRQSDSIDFGYGDEHGDEEDKMTYGKGIMNGNVNANYSNPNSNFMRNNNTQFNPAANSNLQTNLQQGGNTFPMFHKKKNMVNQIQMQQNFNFSNNPNNDSQNNQYDNFDLEYSKEQQPNTSSRVNYNGWQQQVINNKRLQQQHKNPFEQQQLQKQKQKQKQKPVFQNKYFMPSKTNTYTNNNKNSNNSNLLFINENSPLRKSPQSSKHYENGLGSPNQMSQGISCLNSTSNAFPQHSNSRSTSFVNLSLQNRHQMSQSLKQRLQQIISIKNMQRPLLVYLDEINYLKNKQGNYLFDTKGNMFKVNREDGKELQKLGIIRFIEVGGRVGAKIKGQEGRKNSNNVNVNVNSISNGNSNTKALQTPSNRNNRYMLGDNILQSTNNKSKSLGVGNFANTKNNNSKIKSIYIQPNLI